MSGGLGGGIGAGGGDRGLGTGGIGGAGGASGCAADCGGAGRLLSGYAAANTCTSQRLNDWPPIVLTVTKRPGTPPQVKSAGATDGEIQRDAIDDVDGGAHNGLLVPFTKPVETLNHTGEATPLPSARPGTQMRTIPTAKA